jgi:hypothetical protein
MTLPQIHPSPYYPAPIQDLPKSPNYSLSMEASPPSSCNLKLETSVFDAREEEDRDRVGRAEGVTEVYDYIV